MGAAACMASCLPVEANGIYRNGAGARSMGVAGADIAWAEGPLGALGANPAGFGQLKEPTLELGVAGVRADARFSNRANPRAELGEWGMLPEAAFGAPVGQTPLSFHLGVTPEAALSANWRYFDTPGGADGATTYGWQTHRSEIFVLRAAAGLGLKLGEQLTFGIDAGLVYNENQLQTPYIFQSHPALRTVKTLLDLETSGHGFDGRLGGLWRPNEAWQFGVSYKLPTRIRTDGHASGDASEQLSRLGLAWRPDFQYDAEVVTNFPQTIGAGAAWKPHDRLRLLGQIDWLNWSSAYESLEVSLSNGNNPDLPASLRDDIPFKWEDRFVFRGGLEFAATPALDLRLGYSYGKSPVPDETLTPMTAAIMEHTVATGMGWRWGRYEFDLAYQWNPPIHRSVGQSGLAAGEYTGGSYRLGLHWLALSTAVRF